MKKKISEKQIITYGENLDEIYCVLILCDLKTLFAK